MSGAGWPAGGVFVDLYNLHPNAGTADADPTARRATVSELSAFIGGNSAGNAVDAGEVVDKIRYPGKPVPHAVAGRLCQ